MLNCKTILQVKVFKSPSFKANLTGELINADTEFRGVLIDAGGWITLTTTAYVNVKKQDADKVWQTAILWADEVPIQIDPAHRLGIIRDFEIPQTYPNEICSTALMDNLLVPERELKGSVLFVELATRAYLQKIQTQEAYSTVVAPHFQWINRDDWKAECVAGGYTNFVEILETQTNKAGEMYHRLATIPAKFDYAGKFAGNFSWITHPTLFHKLVARNITDFHLSKPGNALDCYQPIRNSLTAPNLWVNARHVELFPERAGGYRVRGASVYGADMTPLRIVTYPRTTVELNGFHLETPANIPPPSMI